MGFSTGWCAQALGRHGDGKDDDPVQALLTSLEEEAVQQFVENEESADDLPEWFDEGRYKRGVETFERNIFLFFTGKMSGLLTLLAIPTIVKVLVLTRQSEEPVKAFRRYVDTIRHMLFWYRTSVSDPKSQGRESIAIVRKHHLRGSAAARRAGMPGISQLDMALTQFAFCGFAVLRRRELHVDASDQDILDFLHVWRTLGYLIGIPNRYNICQFDTDIDSTDNVFKGMCSKWLAPALVSPPKEFPSMSRALLDGVWCMMPVLEYHSYVHFTQELAGVPQQLRCQSPRTYSSMMLAFLHIVPKSMSWPILGSFFRLYHNANMHFSVFMSTYYPLLAWYSFPGNNNTRYQKLVNNET